MHALPTSPTQKTRDILATLVAHPTVSSDSNLGLIEWVRDYLSHLGVRARLTYDASGKKANLFATLGEGQAPGVILSGHTDVVPVVGQEWTSDPFTLVERGGRLYGRGSADMKGFIAVALAHAERFLAAHMAAPVHLALSFDEETGCLGVPFLIKDLQEMGLKPAACIVGEPTGMQPIVAHKGVHRFRCCVRGHEAHSAMPHLGVNAIEYAAQIVMFVRQLGERLQETEAKDFGFPSPYTTLQTTLMQGGTGANIVPRDCAFLVDIRTLPSASFEGIYRQVREYAASLEPAMKKVSLDAGISFEFICSVASFSVDEADQIVQLAQRLSRSNRYERVSFGTEAGFFKQAGIPTVIIGPGAIDDAHRPDESVSLEQLAQAERFMEQLIVNDALVQKGAR